MHYDLDIHVVKNAVFFLRAFTVNSGFLKHAARLQGFAICTTATKKADAEGCANFPGSSSLWGQCQSLLTLVSTPV